MTGTRDRHRSVAVVLFVLYLLFLAYVLLNPSAELPSTAVGFADRVFLRLGFPETLMTPERVEFICNVLILVPVPVLGSVVRPQWSWQDWTAVGFVLAGCVEVTQGLLLPARDASYADVVANTLGAVLGSWVAVALGTILERVVSTNGRSSRDTRQ